MTRHAGEKGLASMMECSGLARDALMGMFRTWVEMKVGENSKKDKSDSAVGNAPLMGKKAAPFVAMNKLDEESSTP
jgi:hypothetical protein